MNQRLAITVDMADLLTQALCFRECIESGNMPDHLLSRLETEFENIELNFQTEGLKLVPHLPATTVELLNEMMLEAVK